MIPQDIAAFANSNTFDGYVIVDWDSIFTTKRDVNSAVAVALERAVMGGEELSKYVKVYRVSFCGQYHETPGARFIEELNWKKALAELMY